MTIVVKFQTQTVNEHGSTIHLYPGFISLRSPPAVRRVYCNRFHKSVTADTIPFQILTIDRVGHYLKHLSIYIMRLNEFLAILFRR